MSSFLVPWHLILYPIKIQPLLVREVTSTGNYMLPVLLGKATNIGSLMKLTKSIPKQLLVCAHQTIAPLRSLDKPAVYAFG